MLLPYSKVNLTIVLRLSAAVCLSVRLSGRWCWWCWSVRLLVVVVLVAAGEHGAETASRL